MTTPDQNNAIEFSIKVSPTAVERLTHVLQNAGFDFQPEHDMIAIDRNVGTVTAGVTAGDELDEVVEILNDLLRLNGESRLLRTDSQNWTLEQRYAALKITTTQLSGLATIHQEPWWLAENQSWHYVADQWPNAPWDDQNG